MTPRIAHAHASSSRRARAASPSVAEPAAPIPASRRRVRRRDRARSTVSSSTCLPGARPARHRRAEREHAVVGVRRDDDDRRFRRIIAAYDRGAWPAGDDSFRGASAAGSARFAQRVVDWRRRRAPEARRPPPRRRPIDPNWGFERGTPIDRVYVERFVGAHAATSADASSRSPRPTTRRGSGAASSSVDILMATEGNPQATIVGDLADAPHIPDDAFDCAIVTQTLQFVYDVRGRARDAPPHPRAGRRAPRDGARADEDLAARGRAVRRVVALHRPLGCGGSRRRPSARGTSRSRRYGNVLAAAGFLYGLAASDLSRRSSTRRDPLYEVVDRAPRRQARLTRARRATRFAGADDLAVDRGSEAAARRVASRLLERVEPPLEADDVGLAEHRGLDRVRRLVDERRQRELERHAAPLVELPERVAQPRVDDEPARLDALARPPSSDDDLRVVVLGRSCRSRAPRTSARGTRSASGRCASRRSPGAAPCARTARASAAGSGRPRSGTSRGAARTGCRRARGCRA